MGEAREENRPGRPGVGEARDEFAGLPAPYVQMLRYGPWALSVLGLGLIAFALLVDRPVPLQIAPLVLGALCFVGGVVLPRTKGQLVLDRQGIRADLQGRS